MPTAVVKAFDGLKPIIDPVLLDQGGATVAKNLRLVSGAVQPGQGLTTLKALTKSAPKTIFRYGSSSNETEYWLEFLEDTDVMRSPIVDNQYGMLYWSDGSDVRYAPNSLIVSGNSYPGASYKLGVPAPTGKPVVAGTAPDAAAKSVTLTAVYTYVTAYGEEGPPSTAADVVTLNPEQNITVSGMSAAPDGAYNITHKRIYVSSTVGSAASFQFWKEIPVATTSTTSSYSQEALGEVIPSTDWVAPPSALKGLKAMANGIAVGFVENTVYLSEPNLPHAWPNQYPVDYKIVGVGTFGQTAVVLTEGFPYLLSGVDPAAMSQDRLKFPQACLSKRSIVETADGVVYAAPDGLVIIGAGGLNIVTRSLMSKQQWQSYNPSSMVGALYDNRYHCFYTKTNGTRGLMIFDFTGQGAVMVEHDANTTTAVTAAHTDPRTDTLYLAQDTNIVRFDVGSNQTFNWRSKVFRVPFSINFGVGQVVADGYPVTLRVYADGVLKATKTVTDNNVFRLPGGFRATDWQFEVEAATRVTLAGISTSIEEMRGT